MVPADVDDGDKDGGQLRAHDAEAVARQEGKGQARLAGDDADGNGDEAEEDVADERGIDDFLEAQAHGQGAAGHHGDDDENKSCPDNGKAYVAFALALRNCGERKLAVLLRGLGLFAFLHFWDLPQLNENTS